MEAQLQELLAFLRDKNPQVRQLAIENLVPHTSKDAPYRKIFFTSQSGLQKPKEGDAIRDLKILCRDQLSVAHDAFKALVNLSDSPILVSTLSDAPFLNFLVSYIINPAATLADLAAMLLSNLTASSVACSTLATMTVSIIINPSVPNGFYTTQSRCGSCGAPVPYPSGEPIDVPALPLLIDAFVQGAQIVENGDLSQRTRKAELHFLASVFANMTTSPAGRNFFFTPCNTNPTTPKAPIEYPLAKLVSFTEHSNTIRRGGVASTIKNCAFHVAGHQAMLSAESEQVAVPPSTITAPGVDALPYLLLPLAGPEELDVADEETLPEMLQFLPPDKFREPDQVLRLMHVESLLLLCHTRWGRDYLRGRGVYEVVKIAHMSEKVDKISEHIERLVTLLKSDEPTNKDLDAETADVVPGSGLTDSPAIHYDNDSDDDDRIEEV